MLKKPAAADKGKKQEEEEVGEAMEAAAKEAEVQDGAERRLPSPPSTPGSDASEEAPMHAAWWAEERPDPFLPLSYFTPTITGALCP